VKIPTSTSLLTFRVRRELPGLHAQLALSDVEELRVLTVQVGDYLAPLLHMKGGIALAHLPYNYPGFKILHALIVGIIG
jgi:hypothetical protein